jgi:hypothetical protein
MTAWPVRRPGEAFPSRPADGGTIRRLDPCDGPGPANVRTFELLPVMYPGDDKAGQ